MAQTKTYRRNVLRSNGCVGKQEFKEAKNHLCHRPFRFSTHVHTIRIMVTTKASVKGQSDIGDELDERARQDKDICGATLAQLPQFGRAGNFFS